MGIHAWANRFTLACHFIYMPGKKLPVGFYLILSEYTSILDAWGKVMGVKASDLCFASGFLPTCDIVGQTYDIV